MNRISPAPENVPRRKGDPGDNVIGIKKNYICVPEMELVIISIMKSSDE